MSESEEMEPVNTNRTDRSGNGQKISQKRHMPALRLHEQKKILDSYE